MLRIITAASNVGKFIFGILCVFYIAASMLVGVLVPKRVKLFFKRKLVERNIKKAIKDFCGYGYGPCPTLEEELQ